MLKYFESLIAAFAGVREDTIPEISKAMAASVNLKHLWYRHDIWLSQEGWWYNVTVPSVLLYVCRLGLSILVMPGEFLHTTTDISEVFLESGGDIGWAMTKRVVMRWVQTFNLWPRLRWPEHVMRILIHCLSFRAVVAHIGQGWKRRRGGHFATWRRRMKTWATFVLGRWFLHS